MKDYITELGLDTPKIRTIKEGYDLLEKISTILKRYQYKHEDGSNDEISTDDAPMMISLCDHLALIRRAIAITEIATTIECRGVQHSLFLVGNQRSYLWDLINTYSVLDHKDSRITPLVEELGELTGLVARKNTDTNLMMMV